MPNWCSNRLNVIGPKDAVDHFRHTAHGPTSSWHNIYEYQDWGAFNDIRMAAILSVDPEPGEVSELSFHQLRPVPMNIRRLGYDNRTAKKVADILGVEYPGVGVYGWQVRNWGVKSDVTDVSVTWVSPGFERNHWQYNFYTPWSPPEALIKYVSRKWPTIDFELIYDEPGMAFSGRFRYRAGIYVMGEEN